ncbi:MAG: hypothetical protein IPL94_09900 [Tetrasphaera sp.]|nr:hypothetical protein [Tetrasphaera sp.]
MPADEIKVGDGEAASRSAGSAAAGPGVPARSSPLVRSSRRTWASLTSASASWGFSASARS